MSKVYSTWTSSPALPSSRSLTTPLPRVPGPRKRPERLPVSLRMQVVEGSKNGGEVMGRSFERCFAEYVVCNMVLFLVVFHFMG